MWAVGEHGEPVVVPASPSISAITIETARTLKQASTLILSNVHDTRPSRYVEPGGCKKR